MTHRVGSCFARSFERTVLQARCLPAPDRGSHLPRVCLVQRLIAFLPDRIPGFPIPRYLANGLSILTGRTRTPLSSLSKISRSPERTPSMRRISCGTVICPLLVILTCFCTCDLQRSLPYRRSPYPGLGNRRPCLITYKCDLCPSQSRVAELSLVARGGCCVPSPVCGGGSSLTESKQHQDRHSAGACCRRLGYHARSEHFLECDNIRQILTHKPLLLNH